MKNKIKFIFGIHNHQPVGNFDFVFEDAYQKAYKPFIDVLEIHTGIKIAMHFTGSLLQWIEKHHPEFIDRIRKLVHIGKIEIVSGAFYEPILSIIPEQDAVEQLNLYTKYLADLFEYKATGLWLAERVWEPNLPSLISNTKLKYTILDESHFQSAGLSNEKINGYFLTEDKGKMLFLFPIDFKLRYTIPFKEVSDTIEYLENMADNENIDGITFADDGEKFGVWPNTYNWVYKNRWLDKFFTALEKNDKIEMITFSEFLNEYSPKDRIYIPTASYNEMMQWALGTESGMKYENFVERLKGENLFSEYKAFVKAGFWRNFFHKYHEANNIHKKMLYVSKKIRQCEENGVGRRAKSEERSAKGVVRNAKGVVRNAESDIQSAKVHLFKAQTNCPYWHGVFGGLYLPHLRYAIYQHLIAAENIIDQIEKKKWSFQHYDFDCDGAEELIFGNEMINIYIKPSSGGSVFELDYKPKCINIMNTMQRRKEAYHRRLKNASIQKTGEHQSIHNIVVSKENDIDKYLFYDWHARYSLLDHFFALDTKIENVYKCCYQEYGDFINQPYQWEKIQKEECLIIALFREAHLWQPDCPKKISVKKIIKLNKDSSNVDITYQITNLHNARVKFNFGAEFNFSFLSGASADRYYKLNNGRIKLENANLNNINSIQNVRNVSLIDEWFGIEVSIESIDNFTLWTFPIETISNSEAGFERIYQNSAVIPKWEFSLNPNETKIIKLNYDIERL